MRTITAANRVVNSSGRKSSMSYDEAFEKIQSLFKKADYKGWELVSPDSLLVVRIKNGAIQFLELEESFDSAEAVLCEKSYRIADYNMWDLWQKCDYWWPTYEEFLNVPLFRKFEYLYDQEQLGVEYPVEEAYKRYLSILNH